MGGDLEVFALQGRHAAPTGVKFGVRTVDRWGMGPKTENFTRFYHTSEYKCLARAYSLHEFYDILGDRGELHTGLCILWGDLPRVMEV